MINKSMKYSSSRKIANKKDKYLLKLQKIEQAEKDWESKKILLDKYKSLKDKKAAYKPKLKVSTTKLIVGFILLNCTAVEIYSMWVMVVLQDISGLYALIAAVVGETMAFLIYALKATKENTTGGITYEKMKLENYAPPGNTNANDETADDGSEGVG